MASVADCASKTATTTMRCDSSAWSIIVGSPFFPTIGSFAAWTILWMGARCVGAAAFAWAAVAAVRRGAAGVVAAGAFMITTGAVAVGFGLSISIAAPATAATTPTRARVLIGRPTVRSTLFLSAYSGGPLSPHQPQQSPLAP